MKLTILTAAMLAVMTACGPSGGTAPVTKPAAGASSTKVDTAVAIAKEIEANPAQADQVLQKRGMTEQQFEDLMYEIASDPVLSEQYSNKVGR